jgi:hypothetical protein
MGDRRVVTMATGLACQTGSRRTRSLHIHQRTRITQKETLMNTLESSRRPLVIGRLWSLVALVPFVLGFAVLVGCEGDSDSDVEDAAGDVSGSMEDVAEEAGEAAEEAGDAAEEALNEMGGS